MNYRFIVTQNSLNHQWSWHARSRNGKRVGWSGEPHKKRSHAIKMAKAMAAGRPVFVKVGDKLIPA